jgi:hypothetical protein
MNWAQGGPIIERENISVNTLAAGVNTRAHQTFKDGDSWESEITRTDVDSIVCTGPTLLIAAMRCYVASRMGDEIEVPDEFTKEIRK